MKKLFRANVWNGLEALIDSAGAAYLALDEEDEYSAEVKREVDAAEKQREAELLAAAARISARNRKP